MRGNVIEINFNINFKILVEAQNLRELSLFFLEKELQDYIKKE